MADQSTPTIQQKGGLVGIGASNPVSKLQVQDGDIRLQTSGGNPSVIFGSYGISTSYPQGSIVLSDGGVYGGNFDFYTKDNGSPTNPLNLVMSITYNRRVGIGTASPNAELDVYTTQGGSRIAATHGVGGAYPKASGISFGATSTSLSVSNNGGTTVFTGGAGIYAANSAASNNPTDLVFWTTAAGSPTERMRISSSGQLRFNAYTSSSSFTGTAAGVLAFDSSGNIITQSATLYPSGSGTTNYVTKWTGANSVGNSQIFDNGSNVGIFTTPQVWTSRRQAVQIGTTASIAAGGNYYPYASFLGNNVYYDADDVAKYIAASGASLFYFNAHGGGNFSWSVADAGAAGSAITFRTPMALNNAGQLSIVGTSNTANNLTVVGNIRAGGSGTTGGEIIASGGLSNGNYVAMRHDDNNAFITVTRTVYDGNLVLQPFGGVLVNTTARSSSEKFQVYGAVSANGLAIIRNDVNQADVNHGALMIQNRSAYAIGNDASIGFALEYDGYPHPRASIGAKTASEYGADLVFNTRSSAGSFSEKVRISQDGNFGINTTAPNRRLTVVGTTRHERVYGYGNNVLSVPNSIPYGTVWIHLGTCNAFTTDKIYYRVNTNTSEEEGEITISNTCSFPFIQWQRNTYNPMIVQVRARMTGGCGNCQVWVQMRYGSDFGGANTTLQWQAYNGTDSGFTVVNATGTPGTGTNEKSIVGNEGYFYANSGSITVADNIGIGTTAPSAKLHIDSALGNDAIRISDTTGSVRMAIGQEASYQGNYINTRNIDMKLQTYLAGGSGGNIIFQTQENGTASVAERGRFTPAGNFGIGSSSPGARLQVNGSGTANTGAVIARFSNSDGALRVDVRDEVGSTSRPGGLYSTTGFGLGLVSVADAPVIIYTADAERVRVTGAGEIWMGYTTDQGAYLLQVNGSVYASAYYESSDIRLKDVVTTRNSTTFGAIQYTWKDRRDEKLHWGYSAQEVMKWVPDAVEENKDGHYTLDYNQAHTYKIAMLEDRVAELEQELKQLKNK